MWLAWDRELARHVALKILHGGEAEEIARFKREARTAAKLSHPNIASVFDVGEIDGHHFIALQYVQGETLAKLKLTTPEALEAIRDAGRALAHAHRQNVIHRDLKPTNIMKDEDGRIYVVDFGLARSLRHCHSITAPNVALGTPAYMSPEQVNADALDERTDVYGLGATLYELVTGRPPFMADTAVKIMRQVSDDEPIPPRRLNPQLPREVQTIILKAMAKEPARRYESASAMVEDIERLQAGDPIRARPASFGYWVYKRLRKDPIRWGLGTAAVLAVLCFGTLLAVQQSSHRRRLKAAGIAGEAGLAYLMGDHDLTRARALEATRVAPENALGWYWLGRLGLREYQRHRRLPGTWRSEGEIAFGLAPNPPPEAQRALEDALTEFRRMRTLGHEGAQGEEEQAAAGIVHLFEGDYLGAERSLTFAHELRPIDWEIQYHLGLSLYFNRRFARAVTVLEPLLNRLLPEPEQVFEAYARAQAATGLMEEGRGTDPQPRYSQVLEASRPYVDQRRIAASLTAVDLNLAEYLMSRGEVRASEVIDRAIQRLGAPHDINGQVALGDAYRVRGEWLAAHGRGEEAEKAFRTSIDSFKQARSQDPGYLGALMGSARARDRLGKLLRYRGRADEAQAEWDLGRSELDSAADEYVEAQMLLARFEFYPGSIEALDAGVRRLQDATRKWPQHVGLWILLAETRAFLGARKFYRGQNPEQDFAAAVTAVNEAVRRNPESAAAHRVRGMARGNWGRLKSSRGEDPMELFRAAIEEDYASAIQINPDFGEAYLGRGRVRLNWGNYELRRGKDPVPFYRAAVEQDYTRALGINPQWSEALSARGDARINWGYAVRLRGADPSEFYRAAIEEDFATAIQVNRQDIDAYTGRALARLNWGEFKLAVGQDPGPLYRLALKEDLAVAVQLNPTVAEAWSLQGDIRLSLSVHEGMLGNDPTPYLRRAIDEDYARAIKLNPRSADALHRRGTARFNWGLQKLDHGEDPTELMRQAIDEDFTPAIQINPQKVSPMLSRGDARMVLGIWKTRQKEDPSELYRSAIEEDYTPAIEKNPASAKAFIKRAQVRRRWGSYLVQRGLDPGDRYDQALSDFNTALRLNPNYAEAFWRRGWCHVKMKNWAKANSDFKRAAELNPASVARFKAVWDRAREKLKQEEDF